jgi:hypothetical protein
MKLLYGLFATLFLGASLTLTHKTPPPPPPAVEQFDPQAMRELFLPDPHADQGLVCLPWMNLLRLSGCPMVWV